MKATKFSSPSLYALSRIVEGSIINAANAHPDWLKNRRFINSVNKRLISSLVSKWPEIFLLSGQTEIKVPAALLSRPRNVLLRKKAVFQHAKANSMKIVKQLLKNSINWYQRKKIWILYLLPN